MKTAFDYAAMVDARNKKYRAGLTARNKARAELAAMRGRISASEALSFVAAIAVVGALGWWCVLHAWDALATLFIASLLIPGPGWFAALLMLAVAGGLCWFAMATLFRVFLAIAGVGAKREIIPDPPPEPPGYWNDANERRTYDAWFDYYPGVDAWEKWSAQQGSRWSMFDVLCRR